MELKVEIKVEGKFIKLISTDLQGSGFGYSWTQHFEETYTAYELGKLIEKLQEAKKQAERN